MGCGASVPQKQVLDVQKKTIQTAPRDKMMAMLALKLSNTGNDSSNSIIFSRMRPRASSIDSNDYSTTTSMDDPTTADPTAMVLRYKTPYARLQKMIHTKNGLPKVYLTQATPADSGRSSQASR